MPGARIPHCFAPGFCWGSTGCGSSRIGPWQSSPGSRCGQLWPRSERRSKALGRGRRTPAPCAKLWPSHSPARMEERTGEPRATDPRPVLLAALTEGTRPSVGLPDFKTDSPAVSGLADLALRKYLASRLIAAWIMFQGNDLRSVARYLRLCLDTAFLFCSAHAAEDSEASRWKEAVRNADLWILHYCDPDLLAQNLR